MGLRLRCHCDGAMAPEAISSCPYNVRYRCNATNVNDGFILNERTKKIKREFPKVKKPIPDRIQRMGFKS